MQLCELYLIWVYHLCDDVLGKIFRPRDNDHTNWEDGSVTGWWVVDVSGVSPDLLVEQSLVAYWWSLREKHTQKIRADLESLEYKSKVVSTHLWNTTLNLYQ